MTRSDEQAARNEKTFRAANERIRDVADGHEHSLELLPLICECEEERCTEIIRVPLSSYEQLRDEGRNFLLAEGHRHRGRVVAARDGYQVVVKDAAG